MRASRPVGTCFGFAVRSEMPLRFLRGGEGGDSLDLVVAESSAPSRPGRLLQDWRPKAGTRRFHGRLYEDGELHRLWIGGSGWFAVDTARRRIDVPASHDALRREEQLWGIPALLCFLARGDMPLHAAAVAVDGRAFLLAAPSMFGKSTLAAAFVRAGHRLLSEDLACLRLSPQPSVVPGPAMLRLRRDVAGILDLPAARRMGTDENRVHLRVDGGRRDDCRPVPLSGVMLLRPSAAGPMLEPARPADALRDLLALSFRLPSEGDLRRSFAAIGELVRTVPISYLAVRRQLADLDATVEAVLAEA